MILRLPESMRQFRLRYRCMRFCNGLYPCRQPALWKTRAGRVGVPACVLLSFGFLPMRLNRLQALRAVLETGSVTEASRRVHRTQPQISRLISALEEEVGF